MAISKIKKVKGPYIYMDANNKGPGIFAYESDPLNYIIRAGEEINLESVVPRLVLDELISLGKTLEDVLSEEEEAGPELATVAQLNEVRKLVENVATKKMVDLMLKEFHAKLDETYKLKDMLVELKAGGYTVDDIVRLQQAGMLPDPNRIRYEMDNRLHDNMTLYGQTY